MIAAACLAVALYCSLRSLNFLVAMHAPKELILDGVLPSVRMPLAAATGLAWAAFYYFATA